MFVNKVDAKSRDDDDDDDVFMSVEDATVSAVAGVDSKRRSQSLSALSNDNASQPADVSLLNGNSNSDKRYYLLTYLLITSTWSYHYHESLLVRSLCSPFLENHKSNFTKSGTDVQVTITKV